MNIYLLGAPREIVAIICLFLQLNIFVKVCRAAIVGKENPRYNVVLVILDDMRPAISGYGDRLAQTPNIDLFMQESFYFTRAYSQVNDMIIIL